MPSPQLDNIGLSLQGFGAGLSGQLPQFLQAQNQKQGLQMQQKQQDMQMQMMSQEMMEKRQKAMFTDANAALQLAESGNIDGVVQLGVQRLQMLKQIAQQDPSVDPSDTQRITQLALAARNGEEEALDLLKDELRSTVQTGQALGFLEAPQEEILSASEVSPEGQVFVRGPAGTITAREVAGFKKEAKDPKIEYMQRVGPNGEIQTIMADSSGKFSDLEGNPIKLGANERLIEGTTLTGGIDDLGLSNAEAKGMRDNEVAARSFVATTGDALALLNEEPNINTFAARSASVVNNLQQEAKAIANTLGMEFDEEMLDPSNYSSTFDSLGIQNQRMRSLVTSLAFQAAAASGQTGRGVSNADINRFISEVGASASDPRAFAQTLMDVANRTERRFKIDYETRTGKPFEGDLGVSSLTGFTGGPKEVTTQAEYDALPSGAEFIENGQTYRKP